MEKIDTTSKSQRTVFLPYVCDHIHVLGAALRGFGIPAVVLPESDQESLDLGRKHVSGKECLPMAITLGDFLKKSKEKSFEPAKSTFFMPTADGPCRFGQYVELQKLIFDDLGIGEVDMLSLNSIDSYAVKNLNNSKEVRKIAIKGIIAVDMIQKALWEHRPYEVVLGETNRVYEESLAQIEKCTEQKNKNLLPSLKEICNKFDNIKIDRSKRKPIIAVIGEFYVRLNKFSNQKIVEKIEEFGGEVKVCPMSEWITYSSHLYKKASKEDNKYLNFFKALIEEKYQGHVEHKLGKIFQDFISDPISPNTYELLKDGEKYINQSHEGEAILSVGKGVNLIEKGKVDGIVNILPFSCMPGLVVNSISKKIKEDYDNFPWLNIDFDGTEGGNIGTRLEAFVYQVKENSKQKKVA